MKKFVILSGTIFLFVKSFAQMGEVPVPAILHGTMSGIKGELAVFWTSDVLPNKNLNKLDIQKSRQDTTKFTNAFLVAVIDSVVVEGIMTYRPLTIAAWWIPLKNTKNLNPPQSITELRDNAQWVAVKTWYSDKEICDVYKSHGLTVGYLEARTDFSTDTKKIDLKIDGDHFTLSITNTGAVQKFTNVLPKYTVIWHADSDLKEYTVFSHGKTHVITTYDATKLEFITKPKTQLGKTLENVMKNGKFSQNFQTEWNNKFGEYKRK